MDAIAAFGANYSIFCHSEHVTSLLNKQTFDALIGSIEEKVASVTTSFGASSNYVSANYNFDSRGGK